jgi:predicted RecB family nuclease
MPTPPRKIRKLTDIPGLTLAHAEKLKGCRVRSIEDLLFRGETKEKRAEISKVTGISPQTIFQWVKRGSWLLIDGIGPEYARLLEEAGIQSAPMLALQDPKRLHRKLLRTNETKKLVKRPPSEQQVAQWIKNAPKLNRRRYY